MRRLEFSIDLPADAAKTVVLPVMDTARIVGVLVAPSAAPGATKSVSVKPVGATNAVYSGDMPATAKATGKLTRATDDDDAKQAVSQSAGIEITAHSTNACALGMVIVLDEHMISQM